MSDENTPKDEQSAERDRELLNDARRQVEEARQRAEETATSPQNARSEAPGAGFVVPDQLGSVRLVREIGRGGMGVVHLGWDELLERNVAVKFLLNAISGPDDPDFAQFLKGARAAAAVKHPGLTTTYHADLVDNVPYLVLEYVDGPTLRQVVKQTGPLSVAATLAVMDAVSTAIGELHNRGIIHRDIKPSNVLLDRDGHVFVTDFGLACARPLGTTGATITGVAGTLAYMAPEMFEGVVSARSDVYALGIMTYELLAGGLPFTGNADEIRSKHQQDLLPLAALRERQVEPPLIEVVERATHKDAMFRHKSARHLLEALKRAVPETTSWAEGRIALPQLVSRTRPDSAAAETTETAPSSSQDYYETLGAQAARKRDARRHVDDRANAEGTSEDALPTHPTAAERSGFVGRMMRLLDLSGRPWQWLVRRLFPEQDLFPTAAQRVEAWQIVREETKAIQIVVGLAFVALNVTTVLIARPFGGSAPLFWSTLGWTVYPLAGSVAFIWLARARVAKSLRRRLNQLGISVCIKCGYDCRGQTEPRCPECGTRFSEALLRRGSGLPGDARAGKLPAQPLRDDQSAQGELTGAVPTTALPPVLVRDISCVRCRHPLRGLSFQANCPKCGTSVSASLRPDRLIFADPKWLSKIVAGQVLIGPALPIALLALILWVVLFAPQRGGSTFVDPFQHEVAVVPVVFAALIVATAVGVLLSTTREPQASASTPGPVTRWSARLFALLALATLFGTYAAAGVGNNIGLLWDVGLLLPIVPAVGAVGNLLLYLSHLAERIPSRVLARWSRAMVSLCIALLLSIPAWPASDLRRYTVTSGNMLILYSGGALFLWTFMLIYLPVIRGVIVSALPHISLFGNATAGVDEVAPIDVPLRTGARRPSRLDTALDTCMSKRGLTSWTVVFSIVTSLAFAFVGHRVLAGSRAGGPVDPAAVARRAKLSILMSERTVAEMIWELGGRIEVENGRVVSVLLRDVFISDAALEHLVDLPSLRTLVLDGTRITDAKLEHLLGLPSLRVLNLYRTRITDAGLQRLRALDRLEALRLGNTWISDAGLVHLKDLTNLETLDLSHNRIRDAGLVHLKGLTNLETLELSYNRISDAGLVHLRSLTRLEYLGLASNAISDAGLVHLRSLTRLERLVLFRTQVSDDGVNKLKQALPKLRVER